MESLEQNQEQQQPDEYGPNDLNKEKFDYVVLGSGLCENILGAALSIAGFKCLFLDQSDRYGGSILNFNFEQYIKYISEQIQIAQGVIPNDSPSKTPFRDFRVIQTFEKSKYFKTDLDYRRFSRACNIDLQPKVLFSKSVSVNELIRSGVSNYLEFQNVTDNFFYSGEQFVKIPFSKSEVFSNTFLSFKEKRQLVKVIEACLAGYDKMSEEEITQAKINSTHVYDKEIEMSIEEHKALIENKDKPIRVFLEDQMGIEKRMQDILLYAIGNVNENQFSDSIKLETITTFGFFERIQKYLRSIGYYGDSPFLLCNYGSSEYAQAFSRIGSLHNCTYIVNDELKIKDISFTQNEDGKKSFQNLQISFNDTPIISKKGLIVGPEYHDYILSTQNDTQSFGRVTTLLRLTIVAERPLSNDHVGLATFTIPPFCPGFNNKHPIRVYQQNDYTQAAAPGYYLVMASTIINEDDSYEVQIQPIQEFLRVFYKHHWWTGECNEVFIEGESGSDIENPFMFGVVYKQDYRSGHSDSEERFSNVIFLKDAPFDTDIDTEFYEAQQTYYKKMGVEHQFLKRPDSEVRMYDDMNDEGGDSDEDNLIDDLQKKMVVDSSNQQQNNEDQTMAEEQQNDESKVEKKEEDKMLDDLLDDLIQ